MFLFKLLTIFIIIIAILLIAVILLQEPKERIIASGGSAMAVQRVGINQKADFLEKATWILASLLLGLTLLSAISLKYASQSFLPVNVTKVQEAQALSSEVVPDSDKNSTLENQETPAPNTDKQP